MRRGVHGPRRLAERDRAFTRAAGGGERLDPRRPGGWASSTGFAAPTTRRSRSTPAPSSPARSPPRRGCCTPGSRPRTITAATSRESAEAAAEGARAGGAARRGRAGARGRQHRDGHERRARPRLQPGGPRVRSRAGLRRAAGDALQEVRIRNARGALEIDRGDVERGVHRRSTRPSASPRPSASRRSTPGRSSTAAARTRASAGSRRRSPTSRPPARSTTGSARRRSPTRWSARATSTCCAATRCSPGSRSTPRSAPPAAPADAEALAPALRRARPGGRRSTSRTGPASCRPRAWRSGGTWRRSPSCSGPRGSTSTLGEREAARRLAREADQRRRRPPGPAGVRGRPRDPGPDDRQPGRGRAPVRACRRGLDRGQHPVRLRPQPADPRLDPRRGPGPRPRPRTPPRRSARSGPAARRARRPSSSRSLDRAARPALEIGALGRFRVLRDGEPIPPTAWQSKKARDLLKILVSRRGRPTTRETLFELLWPDEDPEPLANRLSVALATVRLGARPREALRGGLVHRRRQAGGVARPGPRRAGHRGVPRDRRPRGSGWPGAATTPRSARRSRRPRAATAATSSRRTRTRTGRSACARRRRRRTSR